MGKTIANCIVQYTDSEDNIWELFKITNNTLWFSNSYSPVHLDEKEAKSVMDKGNSGMYNIKFVSDKEAKAMERCPYCHGGWLAGECGWQHAKVFFNINDDGTLETMVNGIYGYVQGLTVCPFCGRPLIKKDD